jgi:hypothetical protein
MAAESVLLNLQAHELSLGQWLAEDLRVPDLNACARRGRLRETNLDVEPEGVKTPVQHGIRVLTPFSVGASEIGIRD